MGFAMKGANVGAKGALKGKGASNGVNGYGKGGKKGYSYGKSSSQSALHVGSGKGSAAKSRAKGGKSTPSGGAKGGAKTIAKGTAYTSAKGNVAGGDRQSFGEEKKKRVPRLAAAFACSLSDYIDVRVTTRQKIQETWVSFCNDSGEADSGFGTVLYLLVQWRVLARIGSDRFRLLVKIDPNFKNRAPTDEVGALIGERPPLLAKVFTNPVPPYHLPYQYDKLKYMDVYKMQHAVRQLLKGQGLNRLDMDETTYVDYQHAVLYAEELQMKFDIALYDLDIPERLTMARNLHKIYVPGLAEKRPSVLRGDDLLLTCKQGKFKGYVHNVLLDAVEVSFHKDFRNAPPFKVHFSFNRTPLRTMHRAVDELDLAVDTTDELHRAKVRSHPNLNKEQREFLSSVIQCSSLKGGGKGKHGRNKPSKPLLLWGPPGTGKTTTLVYTIHAVLREHPNSRILVTAPSNPASDLLCERLALLGVTNKEMLRLVAMMRDARHVPEAVLPFTREDSVTKCFIVPTLKELQSQRVIVATCTTAAYIRSSLPRNEPTWFTHIFVDEAAQGIEAEALIPITLLKKDGICCLAGDFKQLGPVIRSPVAIEYGLQTSLMERIVNKISVNHSRVFTLLDTYRAHPSILMLYNKTIYAGVLRCLSPVSSRDMEDWPDCPRDAKGMVRPVIFHHCNGEESRTKDSPSWQNLAEGNIIKTYLMKLLAHGVEAPDIGIISPYHKQCQRLNFICKGEGVDVEVGTTELFQGREKRVILISTVRSREESEISSDLRFSLGFLGNYKRTNVALSRAKSLLIVVGNMSLLSRDATWHNSIQLARANGCVRGDKFSMRNPVHGENSEWGSSRKPRVPESNEDGVVDRPWREQW